MITRDLIVERLRVGLEPLYYVNAMWLEGADANGHVDCYSDLERLLASICEVDFALSIEKTLLGALLESTKRVQFTMCRQRCLLAWLCYFVGSPPWIKVYISSVTACMFFSPKYAI